MDATMGAQTEPHIARACSWAALLAAFALSWTTWVGVGGIAEYGAFRYALPVCVDGYIVTVLMAWIAPRDAKAARFARWNVYLSAGLSILTQSVYHGATVYSHTETAWKAVIAWLAGALPPLFAALSVHFRTGVRVTTETPSSRTTPPPEAKSLPTAPKPIVPPAASTVSPPVPVVAPPTIPAPVPPPLVVAAPAVPHKPLPPPPAPRPAAPTQPATSGVQNGSLPRMRPMTDQEVRLEDNLIQGRKTKKERSTQRQQQAWRMFDADHASGVHRNLAEIGMAVGVSERCALTYRYNWKAARGITERLKVDA